MSRFMDRVTGKVKQLVAEITGDGKLQVEGKEQEGKAKQKLAESSQANGRDFNELT